MEGLCLFFAGKFHQHHALVDMIGGGDNGLSVNVKGLAAGEKRGGDPPGLHPHLAPDAVGIDDAAYPDKFLLHKAVLVCV